MKILHLILFQKKHLLIMMYTCLNGFQLSISIIIDFEEDKGLVSFVLFQNLGFDDEFLDELKRIEVVEKPLEDGEIAGSSIISYDQQHGS